MRKAQKKSYSSKSKNKQGSITFALTNEDREQVYKLASRFNEGNVSAWVRQAALKYRLTK